MAITQGACISYKAELLQGLHNFSNPGGNVFKMALYTNSANLDSTVTVYSASNEASGSGYTAGGAALTNVQPSTNGNAGVTSFSAVTWTSVTLTNVLGALIYNSTNGNRAVCVINFGQIYSTTNQNFTYTFPTVDQFNAIVRII